METGKLSAKLSALLAAIPLFARSVLIVGEDEATLHQATARPGLRLQATATERLRSLQEQFDAVVVLAQWNNDTLNALKPRLAGEGRLLVVMTDSEPDALRVSAATMGLRTHAEQALGPQAKLLIFVHETYDPLAHAVRLGEEGHPEWGHEVLEGLGPDYLRTPEAVINIFAERLLLLLQWAQRSESAGSLEFATRAQHLFNHLCALAPEFPGAYQCRAEFWRLLGRDDMAVRLLRTIESVAPSEGVQRQLRSFAAKPAPPQGFTLPEDWEAPIAPLRVLYLTHPRPHYGLDVLYDGLCAVLGEANVVDFPVKPWLHGAPPSEMANYPCTFSRATHALTEPDILDALGSGYFDVVVYGDVEEGVPQAFARRVAKLAGEMPFFLLDQVDEPVDMRGAVCHYLARARFSGYFKREMIRGVQYGPGIYPLPFAYPDHLTLREQRTHREQIFFWAGHRASGTRRLYLEHLERRLGRRLDGALPPEEYRAQMRGSVAGLNLFGFGFDTVRYWELPANGCLLLSERLPIEVPGNFVEGEEAVFFDDLAGLDRKLDWLLAAPEEAQAIAEHGHARALRFHTGSARARQMLAWMRQT